MVDTAEENKIEEDIVKIMKNKLNIVGLYQRSEESYKI